MPIKVDCPECGKTHKLADSADGRTFACKQCGEPVTVPSKQRKRARQGARRRRGAEPVEVEVVEDFFEDEPGPPPWALITVGVGVAAAVVLAVTLAFVFSGDGGEEERDEGGASIPLAGVRPNRPQPGRNVPNDPRPRRDAPGRGGAGEPAERLAGGTTLAEADALRRSLKFDEAIAAYEAVIDDEKLRHRVHEPELLKPRRGLALTYRLAGRYDEAIATYELCIEHAGQGPDRKPNSDAEQLAWTKHVAGDTAGARSTLTEAIASRSEKYGDRHPSVGSAEHVLGRIAVSAGEPDVARAHFEQAAVVRSTLPLTNLDRLRTQAALAKVVSEEFDFHTAKEVLEQAQRGLAPFRNHALAAHVEWMLSAAYSGVGREQDGKRLRSQAERTFASCRDRNDEAAIDVLTAFAEAKSRDDDDAGAEKDYREALAIAERLHGPKSLRAAQLHREIGDSLGDQGQHAAAETELRNALAMAEARTSSDDPRLVDFHVTLADHFAQQKKSDDAVEHLERAAKLLQSKSRPGPSDFLVFMRKANTIYESDRAGALQDFDDTVRFFHATLLRTLPKMPDDAKYAFTRVQDLLLGFPFTAARLNAGDQKWIDRSAEWVVNMKGLAVEAMTEQTRLVRESADPTTRRLGDELVDVRNRLARLSTSFSPRTITVSSTSLEKAKLLRRERELVSQLVERLPDVDPAERWVSLDEIRSKLDEKSVLVELWDASQFDLARRRPLEPHFLAWVIPPAGQGEVQLVDLGASSGLHRQVSLVRSALRGTYGLFASERISEQDAITEYDRIAADGFRKIVGPLESRIADYDRWLIAPDSSLWVLPWSALLAGDGKYVCEKWELGTLVTSRTLLREKQPLSKAKPVVVAEPDYNVGLETEIPKPMFSELPGTAKEANIIVPRIRDLVGSEPDLWKGDDANEKRVKELDSPPLLVLSTHGYFAPRGGSPNPLLDCGLALAGANGVMLPGSAAKPGEDGLLTGLEVAGLDLRGTGLVVLSACETGLGKIEAGQGVSGLQQGFRLAGAESVMSTLWSIPDRETVFFMSRFFTYLSEGRTRTSALQEAQRAVIKIRRRRYKASHPIYWASFTITGVPD